MDAAILIAGPSVYAGAIQPASDVDTYKVTVATNTELRMQTFDAFGSACAAPVDTMLTLLSSNGTEIATNDDRNAAAGDLCSAFDVVLGPGTYYARVENFAPSATITYDYRLDVLELPVARALATAPASPAPDATPQVTGSASPDSQIAIFANSDCLRTPIGQGTASEFEGAGITAEIGNNRSRAIYTRASKGGLVGSCTASNLTYESSEGRPMPNRNELEPNNNPSAANGQGFVAVAGDLIAGTLSDETDLDLYSFTLPSDQLVRLETLDQTGGNCPTDNFDTRLRLLAGDGTTVLATDDDSGIAFCDAINKPLLAGNYYIEVSRGGGTAAISDYRLAVVAPATEPDEPEIANPAIDNGSLANATPIAGRDLNVLGGHQDPSDVDWYRIDLTRLSSLRAEIVEAAATSESCESNGIDSGMSIHRADGFVLASDDNGGRGSCSLIDGTGSAPRDAGVFDLPAGTYYIKVVGAGTGSGPERVFDYRLALVAR